jgi:hypothetical protein
VTLDPKQKTRRIAVVDVSVLLLHPALTATLGALGVFVHAAMLSTLEPTSSSIALKQDPTPKRDWWTPMRAFS